MSGSRPLVIAQVGPWPPPWGGIAVYVQRLSRGLAAAGHQVRVYDLQGTERRSENGLEVIPLRAHWSRYLGLGARLAADGCDVAQLHLIGAPGKILAPAVASCRTAGIPLAASFHSFRPDPSESTAARTAARLAVPQLQQAFASGAHVAEGLRTMGVPAHRVLAVPPFVRAALHGAPEDRLPDVIVQMRRRWKRLVVGGGTAILPFAGGDLYGADVFVAMAAAVAAAQADVGFVFQLPRRGDEALYGQLRASLASSGLGERLRLHEAPLQEAVDLWQIADVAVRTSRTDGDAVSVRESLDLGTPTLASDCVQRPRAAILFRSGDGADCATQILATLADLDQARAATHAAREPDGLDPVLAALLRLAERRGGIERALRATTARVQPLARALRRATRQEGS
ncbi:MAG: glycosyltransferase [Deltaproteobacteria bacterium]|nr:glycosyltransferase [Deltaproteobacteria bacterium]